MAGSIISAATQDKGQENIPWPFNGNPPALILRNGGTPLPQLNLPGGDNCERLWMAASGIEPKEAMSDGAGSVRVLFACPCQLSLLLMMS